MWNNLIGHGAELKKAATPERAAYLNTHDVYSIHFLVLCVFVQTADSEWTPL